MNKTNSRFVLQCHHVPYTALTMFITDCQRDRDSATAFRMAFELVGTLVGSALAGTIISYTRVASSDECDAANVANWSYSNASARVVNITEEDQRREVNYSLFISVRRVARPDAQCSCVFCVLTIRLRISVAIATVRLRIR